MNSDILEYTSTSNCIRLIFRIFCLLYHVQVESPEHIFAQFLFRQKFAFGVSDCIVPEITWSGHGFHLFRIGFEQIIDFQIGDIFLKDIIFILRSLDLHLWHVFFVSRQAWSDRSQVAACDWSSRLMGLFPFLQNRG